MHKTTHFTEVDLLQMVIEKYVRWINSNTGTIWIDIMQLPHFCSGVCLFSCLTPFPHLNPSDVSVICLFSLYLPLSLNLSLSHTHMHTFAVFDFLSFSHQFHLLCILIGLDWFPGSNSVCIYQTYSLLSITLLLFLLRWSLHSWCLSNYSFTSLCTVNSFYSLVFQSSCYFNR